MKYSFQFKGETISPPDGFIEELRAIIPADAKVFLEWGAGCSTLLFHEMAKERGGAVYSIDHNREWAQSISNEEITIWHADLRGESDTGLNYSTAPMSFKGMKPDFVLIDGRRRVECAVTASLISKPETVIALHDYRRTRYFAMPHILKVEQDGPHFRVMRAN